LLDLLRKQRFSSAIVIRMKRPQFASDVLDRASLVGHAIRYHLDAKIGTRAYDPVKTGVALDLAERMGPITLAWKGSTRYYRHRFA
jgi:hypothetical protein